MVHEPWQPVGSVPLLEVRDITKRYGHLLANDAVSLTVSAGEVVGVLGENGAGKSTLMNILAGLVGADAGEMRLDGSPVRFASPREAARAGIGMVHQHFMLVGALSVLENLALGDERWGRMLLDRVALKKAVDALARETDMPLPLDARVEDLSVGQQQQVEIARALLRRPSVLILDEPTAVLPPDERAGLLRRVQALKSQGRGILLISHRMEDVFECCDRVIVMRRGKVVGESRVDGLARADLVRWVMGEEPQPAAPRRLGAGSHVALAVEGLTLERPGAGALGRRESTGPAANALEGVDFELRAGEILAVCGVEGNGQSELVRVLAGMLGGAQGRIVYRFGSAAEKLCGPCSARTLRQAGLAHIAEDRLRHALVGAFDLGSNWLLTQLQRTEFNWHGWLRPAPAFAEAQAATARYAIRMRSAGAPVRKLSGGNQQKLVLARELARDPAIVLAAHPTRGLDLATTAYVKAELVRARDRGAAVLLLTSDLAEVWEIADRVAVMAAGRMRGPVLVADASVQEVGSWMTAH